MTRTYEKVRYSLKGQCMEYTPVTAANGVEQAFKMLEGRWKLMILFHLFGGTMLRFSELERAIPAISQKMLIQQLRQMEQDGIVRRVVYHQVPPKVEYGLTEWGQALCPPPDGRLPIATAHRARGTTPVPTPSTPIRLSAAPDYTPPAPQTRPSPSGAAVGSTSSARSQGSPVPGRKSVASCRQTGGRGS